LPKKPCVSWFPKPKKREAVPRGSKGQGCQGRDLEAILYIHIWM
jgi:hypothetical protein